MSQLTPSEVHEDRHATEATATSWHAADPQVVPINVYETDRSLVIVAAMPGVHADDIEITLDGDLELSAALRTSAPKNYLVHEWTYGSYQRTVAVPDGFGGPVTASYGNGQLVVSLSREAQPVGGRVRVDPG